MKKIYVLFNYDVNEIMAISEDRDLLCELMCDYFMNDVIFEWYWGQQHHSIGDTYVKRCKTAKHVWDDIMDWYNNYVEIIESEVVN